MQFFYIDIVRILLLYFIIVKINISLIIVLIFKIAKLEMYLIDYLRSV